MTIFRGINFPDHHTARLRQNHDKRRVEFLTDNKSDFSSKKDNRKPHEDIARELAILDINYEVNVVSLVEDLAKDLRNTPLSVDVIMPLTAVCPKCSAAMYGGGSTMDLEALLGISCVQSAIALWKQESILTTPLVIQVVKSQAVSCSP